MSSAPATLTASPFPMGARLPDLPDRLGGIPAERILLNPWPGTATETDLLTYLDREPRVLCELIDGVLVEKPMGAFESRVAHILGHFLEQYLETNDVAYVYGADGPIRMSGSVRLPDISVIRWERVPSHRVPTDAVPEVTPDLAVEVLCASNTPREVEAKRELYFSSGTRLVWEIDPPSETVRDFTGPSEAESRQLGPAVEFVGGDVLPGFTLSISRLFQKARRGMA